MFKERIHRVLKEMESRSVDQLLVCDPISIYYLTGILLQPGERFWALLLDSEEQRLFANRLFVFEDSGIPTVWMTDNEQAADVVAPYMKGATLGVDKNMAARFLLPLMANCPSIRFSVGSDCVDDVRACKDEEEKARMREVSRINDLCIQELRDFIHAGVTERQCAEYLHGRYAMRGCSVSFESIVSFGANAADPHHRADDTVLRDGDCIVVDIGCKKNDYCSDMTRTWFWKTADEKKLTVHEIVHQAGLKAKAALRPGVRLCDIDAIARNHIADAGYGEYFTHRLGHFIGMEVHEQGDVSSASQILAKPGMIFSIEPGIYLSGSFGVRIEDLVIVTEDGCEVLNHVPREAEILG